jgi:hypothetical protein
MFDKHRAESQKQSIGFAIKRIFPGIRAAAARYNQWKQNKTKKSHPQGFLSAMPSRYTYAEVLSCLICFAAVLEKCEFLVNKGNLMKIAQEQKRTGLPFYTKNPNDDGVGFIQFFNILTGLKVRQFKSFKKLSCELFLKFTHCYLQTC